MSQLAYDPMSKPHRWLLGLVCVCVIGLIVAMMARAIEFKARTAAPVTVEAASADEDDDRPRVPLPAGPRRFQ
jgi:hypothetical protein